MKEKEILNSWKEISQYLEHDVKTCYRWEKKLGLPVHRYDNSSSRSTVFANKSELDEWIAERKNNNNSVKIREFFLKSKLTAYVIALILVISAAITLILYVKSPGKSSLNSNEIVSIGIYPFENANLSEYDEYLAQGITDEISSYLSTFENMKIIMLNNFAEASEQKLSKNNIKADYYLKGEIQKDGENVKIHYKLIKAKNNKVVLDHEINEKLENIQSIRGVVAKQIQSNLNIPFNGQMADSLAISSENHEANDAFLKGTYILNHIKNNETDPWKLYHRGKYYYGLSTRESNELAIEFFCSAIDLDKYFDQAYVGLAQCYLNNVNFGWDNDVKWLDKAEFLLSKVNSTVPKCPEYYSSFAKLYLLKYIYFQEETKAEAFDSVKKGLENYPEHPDLNSIASYCYYLKYGEEGDDINFIKALEYGEKSFWQKPFSINNLFYTELLLLDGQFEKALEICDFVKKVDSSLMTEFRIGEIYYYSGNLEKSESIFIQFDSPLEYKTGALYYLGMIAAQYKKSEKVKNIISQLENLSMALLDDDLRLSSMYFGIDNEKEGFRHLDDFFTKPNTQKLKSNYMKYISLDRNFDNYNYIIRRKYYE